MAKKSFVLRLDPNDYKELEKWAKDEFRSINGQIEYILHKALVNERKIKYNKNKNKDKEKEIEKQK